jgi:hypothetical protein
MILPSCPISRWSGLGRPTALIHLWIRRGFFLSMTALILSSHLPLGNEPRG